MALRDQFNVQVRSDLYNVVPADGTVITVNGSSSQGDIPTETWYYDTSSSATDNGTSIIQPTSVVGNGRHLKSSYSQSNSDWNSGSGASQILNKPSLATVATSGSYNDLSNKPTIKRIEAYSGTTDSSGDYSVTYGTSFSNTPIVVSALQSGTNTQLVKVTSSSTTGFTVNVQNRTDTLGLLPTYAPVNGASVGVTVIEI